VLFDGDAVDFIRPVSFANPRHELVIRPAVVGLGWLNSVLELI